MILRYLLALAILCSAQEAAAQVVRAGSPPARSINQRYGGPLSYASAVTALVCNTSYLGASPSVCYSPIDGGAVGITLTTDTGTKTIGTGVVCTGSQLEEFTGSFPSGSFLIVVDATYPSNGANSRVALIPKVSNIPEFYGATASPAVYAGAALTTTRTGSVEISAYWNGSGWLVSFAGDAVVSPSSSTSPTTGSQVIDVCNYGPSSGNALTTAFRSFRLYPGTFTNAQVQAAALQ